MVTRNRAVSTAVLCAVAAYGARWSATALRNQLRLKPRAAAGDPEAQASVTQRPEAELFGIPNSVYGIVYYLAIAMLAVSGRLARTPWRSATRLATLAALVRSATLLAALWRTHTWCAVCIRAHAVNAILGLYILGIGARDDRPT